jgi:hypothetical protein
MNEKIEFILADFEYRYGQGHSPLDAFKIALEDYVDVYEIKRNLTHNEPDLTEQAVKSEEPCKPS